MCVFHFQCRVAACYALVIRHVVDGQSMEADYCEESFFRLPRRMRVLSLSVIIWNAEIAPGYIRSLQKQ